jgi:hypothetical protein
MAQDQDDRNMLALVQMMAYRMGRQPTENEVFNYIYGDDEMRERIIPGGKLIQGKVGSND